MTVNNKHLLFRQFPDLPEHIMDRIIELYQSKSRLSKEDITKRIRNETDFKLSKKTTCEFIDFARKNCDLKFSICGNSFADVDISKMRFFKNNELIKVVTYAC